jgi:hypothetical protein
LILWNVLKVNPVKVGDELKLTEIVSPCAFSQDRLDPPHIDLPRRAPVGASFVREQLLRDEPGPERNDMLPEELVDSGVRGARMRCATLSDLREDPNS